MTLAWSGHLKFKGVALPLAILARRGIAFVEYCLAVPANRLGHAVYSVAELKTIQAVITLRAFTGILVVYRAEKLTWNHLIGFSRIIAAAWVIFQGK